MQKQWVIKPKPAMAGSALGVHMHGRALAEPVLALLAQRGITSPLQLEQYFQPDFAQLHNPFLLKDMGRAARRIWQALQENQRIMVFGDYDVDGTTSLVTVYHYLRLYTPTVAYRVPDREREGYGISSEAIEDARNQGVQLFIALDCGIKAFEPCEMAASYGIDVIIIDHHLPEDDHLPGAYAVIDPRRSDCPYPYRELSAAGLAFKLLQALAHLQGQDRESVQPYLDLVVCSIAADLVPITGENRILAMLGLKQLATQPRPGLQALMHLAGLETKPGEGTALLPGMTGQEKWQVSISAIVFGLGPRINSAGRVGNAQDAVKLLLAADDVEAEAAAVCLNDHNNVRKLQDARITEEALAMIEDDPAKRQASATVLFQPNWNKGVIGIVASRCIERYHRPTVILTESQPGVITGSARTVNGFDIYDALYSCADLLEQFGGHRFAAGLSLKKENLEPFMDRFEQAVAQRSSLHHAEPMLEIDLELRLGEITISLARQVMRMAPYGPSNAQPLFCSRGVWADRTRSRKVNGRKGSGVGHLKLFVNHEDGYVQEAIGFGMADRLDDLDLNQPLDICYHIELKHYAGQDHVQLVIKDIHQTPLGFEHLTISSN